tara:strand:- start:140 stop:358 length:219 start_codon:yes stop_codon:yes gene_type:complete
MQTLNYNRDTMFYEEGDLVSIPKKEHWSGAQIYRFIDDIQKQCELTAQLDLPQEVAQHYRDLLTRLVKTYGH